MGSKYTLPPLSSELQQISDDLKACGGFDSVGYDTVRNVDGFRALGLADEEIVLAISDANSEAVLNPSLLNREQQRLLGRAAFYAGILLETAGTTDAVVDQLRHPREALGGASIMSSMATDSVEAMKEAYFAAVAIFNQKASDAGY